VGENPSGLTAETIHDALPVRGTLKRAQNGKKVEAAMPWDFPLTAQCALCENLIRKEKSMGTEWEHTE
jgi:hypothetical protein